MNVRWVATSQMVGHILIKIGVSPNLLTRILDWGQFCVGARCVDTSRTKHKETIFWGICDFCILLLAYAS